MFVFLEQRANTGRVLDVAITIYLTVTRKEKRKTNFLLPLAFSEMVLVSWGLGFIWGPVASPAFGQMTHFVMYKENCIHSYCLHGDQIRKDK